ncbi:MAG: DNA alkylation repair protein [Cryomorphaceae bacterium]
MSHPFHRALSQRFSASANASEAEAMAAYMKGHFEFYGIRSTQRKQIQREVITEHGLPADEDFESVILACWRSPQREMHYAAMELFDRKKWYRNESSLALIECMITSQSWWDTVDYIAASLCGSYFKLFPKRISEVIRRWNQSDNLWLVRSTLLFQLKYKEAVNTQLLTECIKPHLTSTEFFLQKAIGWSLRQISKSDPAFVRSFIDSHHLKPVSLREAKKYI